VAEDTPVGAVSIRSLVLMLVQADSKNAVAFCGDFGSFDLLLGRRSDLIWMWLWIARSGGTEIGFGNHHPELGPQVVLWIALSSEARKFLIKMCMMKRSGFFARIEARHFEKV
jgi:hypothetical protein